MGEPAVVVRAAVLLTLLVISGWSVARVGRRDVDLFASTWWGLAVVSVAGVLLARWGRFSLAMLVAVVGSVTIVVGLVGSLRGRGDGAAGTVTAATRRGRGLACVAGLIAWGWFWPPFETFMAAADSTMYVDAGVHLAQTGSYQVVDTVARQLPPELARALFMSVGIFDQGPYIRLPGGLLMHARDAPVAIPAFFPLLSAWTGIFAALGGPSLAPAVAPFGMALAVWALTLFAAESLGAAAALPTALIFLANFAVWWFGRFPMSEPLTIAFVWGGLVFLARGAPFAAGVMLGLAGVARAETLLFGVAAIAWWAVWTPVRPRDLLALAIGTAMAGLVSATAIFGSPNHHVAYLLNDLAVAWTRMVFRVLPAFWDGRVLCALALLPMVPLLAGVVAAWRDRAVARDTSRVLLACGLAGAAVLYLRLGGRAESLRHLGWLATSMSPVGLVLAGAGSVVVWRRGGSAGRLAVILVALVAAFFVPSPRIADYQPWAMRRYLPVVLPGLGLFAGAAIGNLWQSPRRAFRAAAVALTVATLGLQLPAIATARRAPYFADSLENLRRITEPIPQDALVVVDGGFADLQMQVAFWLVFGRESIMATGGGPAWRVLLSTVVANGRKTYWLQNRYAAAPRAKGLTFTPVGPASDLAIHLPDSPPNQPPTVVIRKLVPLQLYGVAAGAAAGDSG